VELDDLTRHPEIVPLLAAWHVREWRHLYPEWTNEAAVAELGAMTSDGVPHTIVAFDGAGRASEDVVGSVSIIDDDELSGFEHIGPWLASLYVRPPSRGHGVGRQLAVAAVDFARAHGIKRLHLFNTESADFYERLGWRATARTEKNGHAVTVMAIRTDAHAPRRAFATDWCTSPWFRCAYSYLRADGTPDDRDVIAEPVAPGLVFAGEAASRDFPGTTHGAWFSGQRAAEGACAPGTRTVLVVGAGMAGIAAALTARERGAEVAVLEATCRLGGRATSGRQLGGAVNVGAAWMHGTDGHPLFAPFDRRRAPNAGSTFRELTTFLAGHGEVRGDELASLTRMQEVVHSQITSAAESAPAGETVADVLFPAIDGLTTDRSSATVLRSWMRGEYENLYAAPPSDLSLRFHSEPFRLPGDDVMITVASDELIGELAADVTITYDSPVTAITRRGDAWCVTTGDGELVADAVVVTTSINVLKSDAIAFDPPLPQSFRQSLDRIGGGLVTKAFFSFGSAFWAPRRAFWVAADPPVMFELWVDVSAVRGAPTLCAFAVGDDARLVEQMSEGELLDAAWAVLRSATGLIPTIPTNPAEPRAGSDRPSTAGGT